MPFVPLIRIQFYFVLFRYGAEVENYLEVYLRTPGLSRSDVTRALLARGRARKQGGESLIAKADHGTVLPSTFYLSNSLITFFRFPNRLETRSPQQRSTTLPKTSHSRSVL